MYGTDLGVEGPDEFTTSGTYPPPAVSVRLGEIRAFSVFDEDDEPILVISDGESSVEFACGLSGVSGSAALGAQRLADAVRDYASMIEANLIG